MAEAQAPLLPKWLRRLFYSVGAIATLFLVAVLTAYLFIKSPFGEALVVDAIVGTLGKDGGISVSIGDIEGDLPSSLTLKIITVRDSRGEWLAINRLDVSWRPSMLLAGRVIVESLTVNAVAVTRQPALPEPNGSTSEIDLDEFADLLNRFQVDVLRINRADLAPEVIGLPVAFAVDSSLQPGQTGKPLLAASLTELDHSGKVTVTAELAANQTIRATLNGALEQSVVRADGSFSVSTNSLNLKGEANISSGLLSVLSSDTPVAFDSAKTEFSITGPVETPKAQLSYSIEQPRFEGVSLERVDGTTDLAWSNGRLSVDMAGGASGLLNVVAGLTSLLRNDGLYALTATLDPDTMSLSVDEAMVESGGLAATFSGPLNLETLGGRGTAKVQALGLGRLVGWSADQSRMTLNLDIAEASSSGLQADVSGVIESITAASDGLTGQLAGQIDLSGDIVLSGGLLQLSDMTIDGPNVGLSGSARLDLEADVVEGVLSAELKTLTPISPEMSGALSANGSITGSLVAPKVAMRLTSDQVGIRQETFEAIDLSLLSDLAQSPRSARIEGTVTIAEGPVTLDMEVVQTADNNLRVAPLSASGAGVSVQGTLDANLTSGLVSGKVNAAFETLALPAALLAVPLSGRANATAEFSVVDGAQAVALSATTESLRYGGASAGLRDLRLDGTWWGGETPRIGLTLEGENGFVDDQAIASLKTTLAGPLQDMQLDMSARAPDDAPQFQLAGRIGVTESITNLDLTALDLTDSWGKLSLERPTRLTFSNEQIVTEDMVFTANDGRLTARLNLDQVAGTIAASLTGEGMPFDLLETIDPDLPITGRFGLSANMDGPLNAPRASARFYTTDFSLPDTDLESVGAELQVSLEGRRLSLSGAVSGLSDAPATVTGSLPLTLDLIEGQARLPLDQPADLSVAWAGAIEPIWVILPLITHRMTGNADVDLKMTGTLGDPTITGYARLNGGTYENLDLGTVLRELSADLSADSASSLNFDLAGTDGDDGRVSGTGRLSRNISGELAGDVSITLDRTRLVRRDDVKVRGSGTVTYALTPDRDRIEGDIQVDSAEVSLTATYAEAVPTLDVVDPDAPAPVTGVQRAGKETDLNIRLTAPRGIDVVGRGLDSEWTADVTLAGTLAAPELNGSLDVSRGEFSFLGELFNLTRGQVLFTGGGQIDPDLSVMAERSTAGITARVEIGGRASAPKITLGADPPLPQDEVLARIIFGKSAGQLGPLEAVQLANAAAELTGLTGRGGVVGTLRRGVGLDVFRFGSDSGGSTVVVGERLSKNIFVGVEQGLEGQGSQIIIEWQLTDNLGVKSTTRQDTGADIGLRWSRDY